MLQLGKQEGFPGMEDGFDHDQMLAGRFRLIRELGSGAVGSVWLANDTLLDDEPIACKILFREFSEDRRAIADLKREVLLTRRLRHPNIVSIYSFWEAQQTRFITMEYVEGRNLSQMLARRESPFTLAEILPWFEQICAVLDYAHQRGVLHRDVKPANILLTKENDVRLADFGIARTAHEAQSRAAGHVTGGTLLFMSPEQLMGESLDHRSDVYSLAATLYELLSGVPPFYKGSIVTQIQFKEPAPIPYCSDSINHVILRSLKKNPNERHDTCGALFTELAAVAGHRPKALVSASSQTGPAQSIDSGIDRNADTVALPVDRSGAKPLGALLMDSGLLSEEQLLEALLKHETTRELLGTVLVQLGYITPETLTEALGRQLGIKSLLLSNVEPEQSLLDAVPVGSARLHRALPVRREGNHVVVAMADPLNFDALNALEALLDFPVEPRIATQADILTAINRAYGAQSGFE